MTTDEPVLTAINTLADEEHRLLRKESDKTATDLERQREFDIDVELARCWDLLRLRGARRNASQDPDTASVRSASIVEAYLQ